MSTKEEKKDSVIAFRVPGFLKRRAVQLNIDFAKTLNQSLIDEISRLEKGIENASKKLRKRD